MKKYESKRHPGTFLTTDGIVDEKTKTLFVTMDGGVVQSMNIATLKRWWSLVDENADTEEPTPIGEPETTEEPTPSEETETTEEPTPSEEPAPTEAPEATEETEEPSPKKKASKKVETDYTEYLEKIDALYNKLNDIYFEGKLIAASFSVDTSKRYKKHCAMRYDDVIETAEIVVPVTDNDTTLAEGLCHNMVHLYCVLNGIKDTCQNGRYHNSAFHREAEARGLEVMYTSADGWAHTTATADFINKVLN